MPIAALVASLLVWLGYTVVGLTLDYSYWTDELFSVSTAIQPLSMQWQIVLNDVHPPLYQALLAAWVWIAGSSEAATRALSAAFVAASIIPVLQLGRDYDRRLVALFGSLLFSSWMVCFYAQETRSYGLLLCLSAWVFARFVSRDQRSLLPLAVALGLTHFFGTLLAGLCLLWQIAEHRRQARVVMSCVMAGLLILIWPVVFLVLGQMRDVMGGNFWIEASLLDVARHASAASFPFLSWLVPLTGVRAAPAIALIVILVLGLLAAGWSLRTANRRGPGRPSPTARATVKSLFLLAGCVVIVMAINQSSPISTMRNFIVLAPIGAFLAAVALDGVIARARALGLFALLGVLALNQLLVRGEMIKKFTPFQDWRGASLALQQDDATRAGARVLVFDTFPILGVAGFNAAWFSFYLPESLEPQLLSLDALGDMEDGSVIYFGQVRAWRDAAGSCRTELTERLDAEGLAHDAWYAEQVLACETGYLVVRGPSRLSRES